MKILLFNFTGQKPNPVYDILAKAFEARGHEVVVGAIDETGDYSWVDSQGNTIGKIKRTPNSGFLSRLPFIPKIQAILWRYQVMFKARAMAWQFKADIVQVNTNASPWLLSSFMPRGMHSTYDIRQINEAVDNRFGTRLAEKKYLYLSRFYTRSIFEHSFFCYRGAAEHIVGADWPNYASVIPVGVDNAFLEFESARLAPVTNEGPVKFVYVGTLSRLRNLEQIIYAVDILRKNFKEFQVTLLGPDKSKGYYQDTIEKLNVSKWIKIEPALPYDEIPEYLSRQHVGLAYVPDRPTWHYQPTIKIKEYRALGLPILSTNVASHRDFIQDGRNGVMVADSPESIAAGMQRFLEDRDFLAQVVANARQMRMGQTWDEIAEEYESCYERLIKSGQ